MRDGLKMYRGSAADARNYVEADRGRADDYYLTEGTALAEHYVAYPPEGVHQMGILAGDGYTSSAETAHRAGASGWAFPLVGPVRQRLGG